MAAMLNMIPGMHPMRNLMSQRLSRYSARRGSPHPSGIERGKGERKSCN